MAGRWTAALLFLVATVNRARADVLPPPTFIADSMYLGFPVGPIIGLGLAAAAVTSFLWLRKQGFRTWTAAPICILAYLLLNLGVYALAENRGLIQPSGASRRFQIAAPSAPVNPTPN